MVTVKINHFDIIGIIGLKNPKALIGSQTTIGDLPFPHKILRMNSCTSTILHKKNSLSSMRHKTSTTTRHSRVKQMINTVPKVTVTSPPLQG